MPEAEQVLVNLRPHSVEVHLPDRVIVVGPYASETVTGTSGQLTELVRRGLVELRPPQQPTGRPSGRTRRTDGGT